MKADTRQAGAALEPPDEELLRGIAAGDEESFHLFFLRWAPPLAAFLRRAGGSREAAEDLLQETFLRVLRGAARFEPRGSPRGWLYRIASNLVYSRWRHERGQPVSMDVSGRAIAAGSEHRTDEATGRARGLDRDLHRAVDALPANQRLVFLLKAGQGMSYDQIAEVLHCPPGTVKSRFHFAVQRLRQELREWDEEDRPGTNGRERTMS
jgi:RNA polymerase sigma-70 factor (ECF subfamily)